VAKTKNFKVLMDPALKQQVDLLMTRKNLKLTPAVDSLMRWLLAQDSLLQSMLLGGIEQKDHTAVARLVLERLAANGRCSAGPWPGGQRNASFGPEVSVGPMKGMIP
jgi:hypothetical protein